MKADVKRFLKSVTVVLVMIAASDVLCGICFRHLTCSMPDAGSPIARDNFRMNRSDGADIVVIGSSRAVYHYIPSVIIDSLRENSMDYETVRNFGIDGNMVISNACTVESMVSRCSPDIILFELSESELSDRLEHERDIRTLSPFYSVNPHAKRYIDDYGFRKRIENISNLNRYNQALFWIVRSLSGAGTDDSNYGYMPLYGTIEAPDSYDESVIGTITLGRSFDDYSERHFRDVVKVCKNKGIRLIVVSSPKFRRQENNDGLARLLEELDVPFINFYNTEYFDRHPELFNDYAHLNDEGAHLFSGLLFTALKPYL